MKYGLKTLLPDPLAESYDCKPPLNADDPDFEKFKNSPVPHLYAESHGSGDPFVAEIGKGIVATVQGLCFSADSLIADSYHNEELLKTIIPVGNRDSRSSTVIWGDGGVEAGLHIENVRRGPFCQIVGPHSANYHHWLLEILPRIGVANSMPETRGMTLIVPKPVHAFQFETLNRLGFKNPILYYDGTDMAFKNLWFASMPAPGGHSEGQVEFLRSTFLRALPEPIERRRLYVSRGDNVNGRGIANEDELFAALENLGFECVVLGRMKHEDQVQAFSEAEIVVGMSGAGLTNIVFAPESCHLIEIHPESYINRAHYFLTNVLGQPFQFVICGDDLVVDVGKVKQCVERSFDD